MKNLVAAVLAAGMVLTAAGQVERAKHPAAVAVSVVRVPGEGVQARAVSAADGTVHLAYLKGEASESDVMYARWDAAAAGFSEPVRVGEPRSAVAMGAVRGAQIAVGPESVHFVWNGSGKRAAPGEGEPLLYARSIDGGKTFQSPRDLMGATRALDGGASVAAGPDGMVWVVWHAAHGEGHEESARGVFVARSGDGGASFEPEARVEQAGTGCCACCALKAFVEPSGRLDLLYRAAAGNRDRDMRLLRGGEGQYWATPVDPWRLDSCPLTTCDAEVAGGRVLLAWETKGQVWLGEVDAASGAISRRASPPGADRHRKHPTIAVDAEGRVLLAWASAEGFGAAGKAGWQVFDTDLTPVEGGGGSGEGLAAWSFPGAIAGPAGFAVIY
jgi:hypothetical protein